MKISMKGGAWKNSEDEILKAAVMKYGKTEWARIASLLPRKTPKQCKARWEEWLDPRIKKTEWTREEDEKLMHLAKVLSGQWRTISSLLDRTAFQCSERYDKLLDMASREDGDEEDEDDDPRQLRSGEIDPHPESRAARPDPIDMDEDEKEMLQEARARLSNTRGKKAKRKLREKEMELSRRLSSIQKRRELKAAGIDYIRKKLQKDGEIDWNAEIPYQKEIPAGYYDVSSEMRDTTVNKHFTSEQINTIEHNERQAAENKQRQADMKRFNRLTQTNLPEAMMQLNRLDKTNVPTKRARLNLPAPTLSEKELDSLLNGNAGLADSQDGSITSNLLTPATPATTLRTPLARDVVMEEAKNQLMLQATPTPLESLDRSIHDHQLYTGTGYNGLTPATGLPETPSTPFTPATPGLFKASKAPSKTDRSAIRSQLASLPTPQNEYEATLPDEEEEEEKKAIEEEIDAEEIERQIREEEEAMEQEEFERRSEVMKRELPRGYPIANRFILETSDEVERMLKEEMNSIIRYEDFKYPSFDSTSKYIQEVQLPILDHEEKIAAEMMILEEAGDLEANSTVKKEEMEEEYWKNWEEMEKDLVLNTETKSIESLSSMNEEEKIASLRAQYKSMEKLVMKVSKQVQKSEKKLNVLLGGYVNRQKNILSRINQLHRDMDMTRINYLCFSKLAAHEQKMLALRMKEAKERLRIEKERHSALQKKYKSLVNQLNE